MPNVRMANVPRPTCALATTVTSPKIYLSASPSANTVASMANARRLMYAPATRDTL